MYLSKLTQFVVKEKYRMFFFSDYCYLCLNNYKSLINVSSHDNDGIIVAEKLKCCLYEVIDVKPDIQKYICSICLMNLNSYYTFKQTCLRNNKILNNYFQNLSSLDKLEASSTIKIPKEPDDPEKLKENVSTCSETKRSVEKCAENTIKEETPESEENNDNSVDTQFNFEFVTMCEPVLNETENSASSEDVKQCKKSKVTSKNIDKSTQIGGNDLKCPLCNFDFSSKDFLVYHLQTHAEIRNFQCLICNKTFLQKSHLIQHTETHTGVKDFECSICYKRFGRKSSLLEHEKIHTGVKDYECTLCNKQFLLKKNLVRHNKNTHPELIMEF